MHVGIVHYAAPPVVGGVELTMFHHARILILLGHHVTVVAGQGNANAVLRQVIYRQEQLVGSRSSVILETGRALAQGEVPPNFDSLVAQTKKALLKHLGHCDPFHGQ